jgi:stage III sporulation protein AG
MEQKAQIRGFLAWLRQKGRGNQVILWLGIGGMLLVLLSELLPAENAAGAAAPAQSAAADTGDASAYAAQLESRLETLIGHLDGAGQTIVMVTLETGEQNVYAVDTREGDAESEQTHVLLGDDSALTETVRAPEICGVAVVCEGGDQVHVVSEITQMLASLLDLSTSRIHVAKMNRQGE